MEQLKTKAIKRIEEQLEEMDGDSTRALVLSCAKNFKMSWIELGRALHTVKSDKLFRNWGFNSFEGYVVKEIGIQNLTAVKLIRSYIFLEKEEPWYLRKEHREGEAPKQIPNYEAVDVLRLAKEKNKVDEGEYEKLKKAVFEDGRGHKDVKKSLTAFMKEREECEPEEARAQTRTRVIRRFVSNLKAAKSEMIALKLVPQNLIKQAENLIDKIEACL